MSAKNGVKVVKRAEREAVEKAAGTVSRQPEEQPNLTRTVARQVTAWVKEFHERRALEARQNLQLLNAGAPALN